MNSQRRSAKERVPCHFAAGNSIFFSASMACFRTSLSLSFDAALSAEILVGAQQLSDQVRHRIGSHCTNGVCDRLGGTAGAGPSQTILREPNAQRLAFVAGL